MSKSLGNVIAPEQIINQYGAEILRLWVSAEDYRDDIRISEDILKRLSEAYRRIRNTCRFLMGNLSDFDPAKDAVPQAEMLELDRFALHQLQDLIQKIRGAYERFEFHRVYHALHNYCVVDLSAFYLDILKDRLYTSARESLLRRSAQTALWEILTALLKLMAPILSFTAEEAWGYLPQGAGGSVHAQAFPEVDETRRDTALSERWSEILLLKSEVARVLETARQAKIIGHALDAEVALALPTGVGERLVGQEELLRTVFIVSGVRFVTVSEMRNPAEGVEMAGLLMEVQPAAGEKCERCWVREDTVGSFELHPKICRRCHDVIQSST
jgi:isoleucyl-tRNA synthetase